jgi:AcrR family transcriptional regulator
MAADATRSRLIAATLTAIREVGFAGVSARVVAGYADVNQALIFYHFGSVDELVAESCRQATAQRVSLWADELEEVTDLPSLVAVARRLHAVETAEGNVAVLAQALAASRSDARLAAVVGTALQLWLQPLHAAAARILAGTVLEGVLAPAEIARTAAAAFVGVELFDGVVPDEDADAFEMLERIAALGALVLEAGPITKAAVRRRLRAAAATSPSAAT